MLNQDLIHKGITYLGKHSYRDYRLTIASRDIGYPEKVKVKYQVPYSNTEQDFSMINGSQNYSQREVTYQFNIAHQRIQTKESMYNAKTLLVNWLMNSTGKQDLWDDYIDGYHFHGEVESGPEVQENWIDGTVDVTFLCYPFMISDFYEGDDIWDTFDFEFGVSQATTFGPVAPPTQAELIRLSVGDRIAYVPWIVTEELYRTKLLSDYYTVSEIISEATADTKQVIKIKELAYEVTADLFLQSLKPMEVELINTNSTAVLPEIQVALVSGGWYQIAIELDGVIHYLMKDQKNTTLRLKPGVNKLKIWAYGVTVSFLWHKELL